VKALRPAALDRSSFPAAIKRIANQTSSTNGIRVQITITGMERNLHSEIEDNLLRITQEALANTVKHSNAKEAKVRLSYGIFHFLLRIEDDGDGFNITNPRPSKDGGFGLIGMKERAERIRGRFSMESRKGEGTKIQVTVPLYRWRLYEQDKHN
jgi:signal transduction histidine kinase